LLKVAPAEVFQATTYLIEQRRELKRAVESGGKPTLSRFSETRTQVSEKPANVLGETARLLSVAPLGVAERIEAMQGEIAALEKRLTQRDEAGPLSADALLAQAVESGGVTVVVAELPGVEPGLMRQLIDQIRQKASPAAVLLATRQGDEKLTLVAGISKDLQQRGVSAGNWIRPVAEVVGGGGGGRPDLAQAGGKHPEKLPEALDTARKVIAEIVAS
jgi:alanyl-tRNA synthetase